MNKNLLVEQSRRRRRVNAPLLCGGIWVSRIFGTLGYIPVIQSVLVFNTLLLLSSCGHNNRQQFNSCQVKVVEARGYVVPKNKMAEPKVFLVDERKLKKIPAGKPTVVLTNTNIHPAGKFKVVLAGTPRVITPGTDTFSLPKTVPAIDSPFVAGVPEVVIAKDMANKGQNPENFSYFGKLQGLKHEAISCMIEDKSGNLWLGTYGGVSKYDGKSFTLFTDKEGLSNNVVNSILEDKSGNLWFGTYSGGVSKYDGKTFTHFTEKEGLTNNVVNSILEDKSGNLWFGTEGSGISKYNGKSFTHFSVKEGLSNNNVFSMLEDNTGNLWFCTNDGVSKYDGKRFTIFTEKEGLGSNDVRSISEDKSGNLWFGTFGGGVSKYDGKSFTQFTEKEGLSNNYVSSILEDKSGNLWFGTYSGGVSKYDGKSFTHFTDKEGLSYNEVYCILEDKSGNLWFGTLRGLSKYNGKSFTYFTDKEGLTNNNVLSILEDKSGNLWFGTLGGVSKYDGKSFTHFTDKEGLCNNVVWSIIEDKNGNLWFGTNTGISKYDGKSFTHFTEKEGLGNNVVWNILEDKSGNLWFATYGGGVTKYDGKSFTRFTEKEGLGNNNVWRILEDKSGNLWFATYSAGVTKFDGKRFTQFTEKEGLGNNNVWSILEDKSGNLWFGTYGGGISKYDGKSFTHFTDKEGLGNNYISSILEDKSGNLWFGTRFGLSKLTREKLAIFSDKVRSNNVQKGDVFFKNYTYADGFLGIGCNRNAILESKAGTIWIGTNERLTALHPEGELTDTIAPNIQLTALELFNEHIDWVSLEQKKDTSFLLGNGVRIGDFKFEGTSRWYNIPEHLSLAYNNNWLTFIFIGITMVQSRNVKYQYKLEGMDENWSDVNSRNNAPYGNLPQGTYTFKVRAMNSEGYWSKELNYTFTIRPPWWKTWWFRTLVVLILIAAIGYYIKNREKKLVAEKEKLEKTVTERTAEVVKEKQKSDELLLNILPIEVAEELKKSGEAKAKSFTMVTVMFTDFKDFTSVSEKVSAELLVDEIHHCFSAFDNVIQKYKIEKIKTIGDSYMCASGLPVLSYTHATDMINAAFEIRDFMLKRKKEKEARGEISFELRIGIHTGPVVAGIVGVKKFAYDIWGDTVNIASRMESSGEPGKVNISGSTHELVKDKFTCTYRGKVVAKHKGEIDMYFVEPAI